MREILFRGKRIDSDKWAYGSLILWGDGYAEICISSSEEHGAQDKVLVCPETVGQYTGMKDKNGNRIFEGDILSIWNDRNDVVVFEDGAFILEDTAIPMRFANKFEVIGNITDNPELLEK